ncbi:MAG TPA: efflux RND transporter periplasmic adaptor subunit [Blastocatellia bacterium]|nr:efflux RND transporter periplasmic adaptor subunit [Blastocatellia bacterium]
MNEEPTSNDTRITGLRRKRERFVLLVGLAIVAVVILAWAIVKSGAQKTPTAANAGASQTQTVVVASVVSQELSRQVRLPGELQAYQDVALYPKVQSFVEWIGVDRGSVVKAGQLLMRLSAPELAAQLSEAGARARGATSQKTEAEARVGSIKAQRLEAEAKLASDEATYNHLKAASATPGVVAGNDVQVAHRLVEADRARVKLYEENERAAVAQVQSFAENAKAVGEAARSVQDIESYLRITAPFDGVITERNVHKGSLVGPSGGPASSPLLRIRQVSTLRLVVAVPEADVAGISASDKVNFSVPAFPGKTFSGEVRRIAQALDLRTRTMPVELDVANSPPILSPGMYAEVIWPVGRKQASLFVPPSAIATTTERTFVIRIRNGTAEWVDVKRGQLMGDLIEVFGLLDPGDEVAIRGTDELREGTQVTPKQPPPK